MLHIKLPKGKTAIACERAAKQCSQRIQVANKRLSEWARKTRPKHSPPDEPRDIITMTIERDRLHQMADMAKHSTGDVYVSIELWNEIKGYYNG